MSVSECERRGDVCVAKWHLSQCISAQCITVDQMFDSSAGSFQIIHSLLQYLNILNMQTPDTKTMIS